MAQKRKSVTTVRVWHENERTYACVGAQEREIAGPLGAMLRVRNVKAIKLLPTTSQAGWWAYNPYLQIVRSRRGIVVLYEQPAWHGQPLLAAVVDMCGSWRKLFGVSAKRMRWARMVYARTGA